MQKENKARLDYSLQKNLSFKFKKKKKAKKLLHNVS